MYLAFDATRTRFRTAIACLRGCGHSPADPRAQGINVIEEVVAMTANVWTFTGTNNHPIGR
jgi:hypothetical protein